jgi:hypothetical protein
MNTVAIMLGGMSIGVFIFIGCMAVREGLVYIANAIRERK